MGPATTIVRVHLAPRALQWAKFAKTLPTMVVQGLSIEFVKSVPLLRKNPETEAKS